MAQTARRYIEIEVDASKALRALKGIEDSSKKSEKSLGLLQRQMAGLGAQFRGFVGFLGVQELVGFADAAKDVQQRLGAVGESAEESKQIFEDLLDIGNRLGIGISELASSYTKLAVSVPTASTEELGQSLNTISTILATTGASTQQVNAVLLQLSQALGSGALQGDEFRATFENAPVLLRAWQEAAGLTGQSLRDLSSSAALTTESFFEFLPEITKLSAEMIGTTEVALTVARAFEALKNNIIALFTDSEAASLPFTILAQAIKLVADNLGLLIAAATAFGAIKLAGMLTEAAVAAGILTRGLNGLVLSGAVGGKLTAGWVGLVDAFTGADRGARIMAGGIGLLRDALNTALGAGVALFAAFSAWEWAIDRINEAAGAMDALVEKSRKAASSTKEFADEMSKIRNLDIDTASFSVLDEAAKYSTSAIRSLQDRIEATKEAIAEVRPKTLSLIGYQEDVDNLDALEQQLVTLEKQLTQAEIASDRTTLALTQISAEARAAHVTFKDLVSEIDEFGKVTSQVDTRTFKLRAELEMVGLEGVDKIKAEVARQFEEPIELATVKIAQAASKKTGLTESLRTAPNSAEVDEINKAIETQNEIIQRNTQIITANATAQNESAAGLVAQRIALEEATAAQEARTEALALVRSEFEDSLDVQFALQDLYDEGAISAEQLAAALNELGDAAGAAGFQPLGASMKELADNLAEAEREAVLAEQSLALFATGGEQAVAGFRNANAVMDEFNRALALQGTTMAGATDQQLEFATSMADIAVRTQEAADALEKAKAAKGLADSLAGLRAEAAGAEQIFGALASGGEEAAAAMERANAVSSAYEAALKQQGATLATATDEQLAYADAVAESTVRIQNAAQSTEQWHQTEELANNLALVQKEAVRAERSLEAYAEGGQRATDALARGNAVMDAYTKALKVQKATVATATERQLEYAVAVAQAVARTQKASQATAQVDRARELAASLKDVQQYATNAEGALAAYRRSGDTGLATFERQVDLQEAFVAALEDQETTLADAGEAELDYAEKITRALKDQLDAQDKLNAAQNTGGADFRRSVEAIGEGSAEIDVESVYDLRDYVAQARSVGGDAGAAMFEEIRDAVVKGSESGALKGFTLEDIKSELAYAGESFHDALAKEKATVDVDVDSIVDQLKKANLEAVLTFGVEDSLAGVGQTIKDTKLTGTLDLDVSQGLEGVWQKLRETNLSAPVTIEPVLAGAVAGQVTAMGSTDTIGQGLSSGLDASSLGINFPSSIQVDVTPVVPEDFYSGFVARLKASTSGGITAGFQEAKAQIEGESISVTVVPNVQASLDQVVLEGGARE